MSVAKRLIQRIATVLIDEYRLNWVVASTHHPVVVIQARDVVFAPLTTAHWPSLDQSSTAKMSNSLSYARAGLAGFAMLADGIPLSVAHFAGRAHYDRDGTWLLRDGDVALMDIATEESARGRGLAVRLIADATAHYRAAGADRLIAFIWWSNRPSLRAFAKAGWRKIGLSFEYRRGDAWRSIRIPVATAAIRS